MGKGPGRRLKVNTSGGRSIQHFRMFCQSAVYRESNEAGGIGLAAKATCRDLSDSLPPEGGGWEGGRAHVEHSVSPSPALPLWGRGILGELGGV